MSGIYEMRVSFEMKNGSTFSIEWTERRYDATFDDPAEVDAGEYIYLIDEDEMEEGELPKGLADLADTMYNNPDKFSCDETYIGRRPVRPW